MEGDGPVDGQKIDSGWALASFDALGADSLTAYLMGFDPAEIGYLRLLQNKGFGFLYPDNQLEISGEEPETLQSPYKPPHQMKIIREWNRVSGLEG